MNISVMNTSFERIAIIDTYDSLIWSTRYNAYGDFELYLPAQNELFSIFIQGYYLTIKESETVMIIESLSLSTDAENGDMLIVKGRSLESLLTRRIIWPQTTLTGNVQNGIKKLINDNIGINANSNRQITNFVFNDSSDSVITSVGHLQAQFTGTELYEAIVALCEKNNWGFKVSLQNKQFVFSLYVGRDLTSSQIANPRVIFSPNYDSLLDSSYNEDSSNYKNYVVIAGEGEGESRTNATYDPESATGLDRRELYVDARDISSETSGGNLSSSEYNELLIERGTEKLLDHLFVNHFEAEPIFGNQYEFGVDYKLGDLVELENGYGLSAQARVVETIISDDESGYKVYPSFELVS